MVSIQASEWSSHSRAWIGTILNADFEELGSTTISILILKPELTYDGGTASYHLGMTFLYSSPQIGTMQSPIQLYTDASGTCGYEAYLDGALFGGNCPHQCLKSWLSSRRSPRDTSSTELWPLQRRPPTGQGSGSTTPSVTNLT